MIDDFPPITPEGFTERFGRYLGFSAEELEINRSGRMSLRQRGRLAYRVFSPLFEGIGGAGLIVGGLLLFSHLLGLWMMRFAILFAMAGLGAGLARTLRLLWYGGRDLWKGEVHVVEGRLNPSWKRAGKRLADDPISGSKTIELFAVVLGGVDFAVNESVHTLLIDSYEIGLPSARVYYLPVSKQIQSMEVVNVQPNALQESRVKKKERVSIWRS